MNRADERGMNITIEKRADGFTVNINRPPLPEHRFRALCKLAGAAIGGAVLLLLVHMLGVWGLVWSVGTVAMYGLYKLFAGLLSS